MQRSRCCSRTSSTRLSAEAQRDAAYTNRAILRFLSRFAGDSGLAAGLRLRNGIQLINPLDQITQGEAVNPWEKAMAIAATEITWLVRDINA
jgi:hypothetical protein